MLLSKLGNIEPNKIVVVDFYTNWCGPCILMKGVIARAIAKSLDLVLFLPIDVDSEPELASKFNVKALPTVLFYNSTTQELLEQFEGAKTEADLIAKIQRLWLSNFQILY